METVRDREVRNLNRHSRLSGGLLASCKGMEKTGILMGIVGIAILLYKVIIG